MISFFFFLVIVSIFFLVRLALKKAPSPYQACQYFASPLTFSLLGCSGRSQAVLRSAALLAVLYHVRYWYSNWKIHLLQT